MNDDHVIIRGRKYRYDPDFDAYYAVVDEETTVSKYAWLAVVTVLAAICYGVSA
jgi:hypothetical protein